MSLENASKYPIVNLPVRGLRPSEEINIDHARALAKTIADKGQWTHPILVETQHWIIMDGHHRYFCATELGLSSVPCVLLSYDDPNLHVTYWSDHASVAVEQIIQAGLSGDLMRFKTTRHTLEVPLPRCSVSFDDLR